MRRRSAVFFITVHLLVFAAYALAQAAAVDDAAAYRSAMAKHGGERIRALEKLLAASPNSGLKLDALEMLVWESSTNGSTADLEYWTSQLAAASSANPMVAAMIVGKSLPLSAPGIPQMAPGERARHALNSLSAFKAPQMISPEELKAMQAFMTATLNGVAGYSYFEQKDYESAKPLLRKSLEADPNNAQYAYTLALCDFQGEPPDEPAGYRMLARTVNLTKGTPAGEQLAQYARNKYVKSGGSSTDWDKYLAVTTTPGTFGSSGSPASNASNSTAERTTPTTTSPVPANTPSSSSPPTAAETSPIVPRRDRPLLRPSGPLSIGLLVEANLVNDADRKSIANSLGDMVRHLKENDEAFVMSFSKGVVFEEDLTSNNQTLEAALDSIAAPRKKDEGAALYDAVTYAAGHLNRVARNTNRVLLVVTAQGDRSSTVSPLELSNQVNLSGVRIFCIGVGVMDASDQGRLKNLADVTGGQVVFVPGLQQFRGAAHTVARDLGIEFPQ